MAKITDLKHLPYLEKNIKLNVFSLGEEVQCGEDSSVQGFYHLRAKNSLQQR